MSSGPEITRLRKEGRLDEALAQARAGHAAAPGDIHVQRAYGWVLHAFLKQEIEDFERQRVPAPQFARRFEGWLDEYRVFGANERPNLLYSQVLNQAVKASRACPGFLAFARWWEPRHLTADDEKPFTLPDGRQAPSLEMRLHYAIGRALSSPSTDGDRELLDWAETQQRAALERHPDDPWLHYYRSKRLLDEGLVEEARRCLAPVVRRQRKAAWAWTLLGQTFETQSPNEAIACHAEAVRLAVKPMEVANTRVSLADLLAQQGRFDAAAIQVHHALAYRVDHGFRIPPALQQLAGSRWFARRGDLAALADEAVAPGQAAAILQALDERPLSWRAGVVDNRNAPKALVHVAFSMAEGTVLHFDAFEGVEQLQPGVIVELGYLGSERRPSRFRLSAQPAIAGFCRALSGSIEQREGQAFGFLLTERGERAFVPPALLAQAGTPQATGIACLAKDRKGAPGWRVLAWR